MPEPAAAGAPSPWTAQVAAWRFVGAAWRCSAVFALIATAALALALHGASGAGGPLWMIAAGVVEFAWAAWLCARSRDRQIGTGQDLVRAWRAAVSCLLMALFAAILLALLSVVILCLAYAVASAGKGFDPNQPATWAAAVDARGRWVIGLATLAGGLALLWALLRVSLAPFASVARGRVQMLSAWPVTRGALARIVLALLIAAVAPAALIAGIGRGAHVPSLSGGTGAWLVDVGAAGVIAGLWIPLKIGVMSEIYRQLVPDSPI